MENQPESNQPIAQPAQPTVVPPQPGQNAPPVAPYNSQQPEQTTSTTDVWGIVGIVFAVLGITIVGLICGIIGINKAKKGGYSKTVSVIAIVLNLIVMALVVLGFIVGLVIGTVTGVQQRARDLERENDVSALMSQVNSSVMNGNTLPKDCNDIKAIVDALSSQNSEILQAPGAVSGEISCSTTQQPSKQNDVYLYTITSPTAKTFAISYWSEADQTVKTVSQ